MIARPTLLTLLAAATAMSVVTNAVSAADPAPTPAPQTRLGASIQQDLAARDQQAAQRNRALDLREQAARATEARLQSTLQEQGGRPGPRRGATGQEEQEQDQYAELARIYQAMRPNRAAAVFEQLQMEVQVEVAHRMRERSTALILANMSPRGAAALTMAMARRTPQGSGAAR